MTAARRRLVGRVDVVENKMWRALAGRADLSVSGSSMKIEAGRRYRVTNLGGASEIVTAQADWQDDIFLPVTIVPSHPRLWLRIGGKVAAPSGLYTIDLIEEEAAGSVVAAPRPFLGDDPGAFREFQRIFADWDFSTGTY